ncbi:MAG: type II toxin-antitoxin system VapC family toxin [Chloroflexota bacterium]|nr:type II toxin-antitoxin system VapC family toxin [Anaerolineae bacterium]
MTAYFFDSSALVKRYVAESGTAWVRTITAPRASHTILISQIAPIETVSAIMRRKRDGSLPNRTAQAARLLVDRHAIREYKMIYLSNEVSQIAENLLDNYALRAADAIQLSAALEANVKLLASGLAPLTFVCADTRLNTVAVSEGLPTYVPV